jgi:hypothetical protein
VRRRLVGLVLLAGCIDIPPPLGLCDPADPDQDGDGWACNGVVPDCNDQPDDGASINPGAIDNPLTPDDEDCTGANAHINEQIAGVSLGAGSVETPLQRIDLGPTGALMPISFFDRGSMLSWMPMDGVTLGVTPGFTIADATATREFPQSGPAYADVRMAWTAPATADAPAMSGVTRFAFRPDGVTIRDDQLSVHDPGFDAAHGPFDLSAGFDASIGGGGPTSLVVTDATNGYVSLPESGSTWDGAGQADPALCFVTGAGSSRRSLSIAWTGGDGVGPSATVASRASIRYDWARQAATLAAGTYRLTQVLRYRLELSSLCGLDGFTAPAPLDILQGDAWTDSSGDRDHDGYDEMRGLFWIATNERYVEFYGPFGPFLVRAVMRTSATEGVTVWLDGERLEAGKDYLVQWTDGESTGSGNEGRQAAIVWFPDDVIGKIRIALPGGEPTPP